MLSDYELEDDHWCPECGEPREVCNGWGTCPMSKLQRKDKIGYDFSGCSDIDLVLMQKQVRDSSQDKDFLDAILKELGKRQHA